MTAAGKRCVVAYAGSARQHLWAVQVPLEASIADAIEAARRLANEPEVPWDCAPVGVFGELRERTERVSEGDRIELYRALRSDPRERRRTSVQRLRKSGGR